MNILYAIFIYISIVFFILRLVIPYAGLRPFPHGIDVPETWKEIIVNLNKKSLTDDEYVFNAYSYIVERYTGNTIKTFTRFWYAFQSPFCFSSGYLPCTSQNFLIYTMLIQSGRFSKDDIKVKVIPRNFFVHHYLEVQCNGKWVVIDPWARFLNVPFGKHLPLFSFIDEVD